MAVKVVKKFSAYKLAIILTFFFFRDSRTSSQWLDECSEQDSTLKREDGILGEQFLSAYSRVIGAMVLFTIDVTAVTLLQKLDITCVLT